MSMIESSRSGLSAETRKLQPSARKGSMTAATSARLRPVDRHQVRHAGGAAAVAAPLADLGQPLPHAAGGVLLRGIERSQDVVEVLIERSGPAARRLVGLQRDARVRLRRVMSHMRISRCWSTGSWSGVSPASAINCCKSCSSIGVPACSAGLRSARYQSSSARRGTRYCPRFRASGKPLNCAQSPR